MSQRNATTVTGYVVATIAMIPFFWLTTDDAYGRFMLDFDPAASFVSYYLEPYSRHFTGLVCLAAPLLLAYPLRHMVASWVDSAWSVGATLFANASRQLRRLWHVAHQRVQRYLEQRRGMRK